MITWTVAPRQLITSALIGTIVGAKPSWSVHDHPYVLAQPTYSYLGVFSVPGGFYSGPPLTAPNADVQLVYEMRAIGTRRDQAQLLGDSTAELLLGRDADGAFRVPFNPVPGWAVCDRMPTDTEPGGVEVVPGTPTLYQDSRRYTIALTPQR
jgi:hypothetical protein